MTRMCLITGGAGVIGSHLVEALAANGRAVRVFDDLSTRLRQNLPHIRPAPELVTGNLADAEAVEGAAAGCDVIYHLGAVASVARSAEDPLGNHAVNATGTLNVLQAARNQGVRRVVYAGSASAYGGAS